MIKNQKQSLEQFLLKNEKMLTIFGIFVAITVFTSELPLKSIGRILNFIFIANTILIWLELWKKFPKEAERKLKVFENLISYSTIFIIFYWFLDFRDIWSYIMTGVLMIVIASVFSFIIGKYDIFNKIFHTKNNKKTSFRYIVGITFLLATLYLSSFISNKISLPINNFLDEIYHKIEIQTNHPIKRSSIQNNPISD